MHFAQQDKINEIAFRFGFLVLDVDEPQKVTKASHWRKEVVSQYSIFLHPETSFRRHHCEKSNSTVIVIGEIFCCTVGEQISDLLDRFLAHHDWDALDKLSGRFCMLASTPSKTIVLQDPFGSRTVYYKLTGKTCIASHAVLISEQCGIDIDIAAQEFRKLPEYKQRGTGYLPGKRTMFAQVKCLLPNTFLTIETKETKRFWPRRARSETTMRQFLEVTEDYFCAYAAHLEGLHATCLLGLTGGVDTRAVIAGLIGNGIRPELVTWTGHLLPDEEIPVVADMVEHLGFPHRYIEPRIESRPRRVQDFAEYTKLMARHVYSPGKHPMPFIRPSKNKATQLLRATNLATGYSRSGSKLSLSMRRVVGKRHIFVRGYGGEILRGFYNRHLASRREKIDFSDLSEVFYRLYKTRRVKDPSRKFEVFAREAMSEFVADNLSIKDVFDYDILDLFYWEQRMGVWGSNMHNEMDPVVYSCTGMNSRLLYNAGFGLKTEERLGEDLLLKMTSIFDQRFAKMVVVS